jgi:protein TonB
MSTGMHSQRLTACLLYAIALHAVLIFGLAFEAPDPGRPLIPPGLDVTLVQRASAEAPDDAAYIAQANQVGGGNSDEQVRPTMPVSGALPAQETGPVPEPTSQAAQQQARQDVVAREQTQARLTRQPDESQQVAEQQQERRQEQPLQAARLEAEVGEKLQAYSKRPRKKFLSANTKEHRYARYMDTWVRDVERVGNANYPIAAVERGISGELLLSVAIRSDGSIDQVRVVRPSGHAVLDEAAERIVRLAAPYEPLPPEIREEADIIQITRTWQFLPGAVLRGR